MTIFAYSDSPQDRPFLPRSPRFGSNLPNRFSSPDGLVFGRCVDVSESGLLGVFVRPLNLWTSGELIGLLGEEGVTVKARVARIDNLQAGLSFQRNSESERLAILRLMDLATRHVK